MKRIRIIPVLLLDNTKLVKTIKYSNPNYIGDPINAVKIFNEKEVDEIAVLDISASVQNKEPNYDKIEEIASEAFMPFAYGGGITTLDQIKRLFKIGIEKVVLNSILATNINLISEASKIYGSQSIIVSVDVKKKKWGKYGVYSKSGTKKISDSVIDYVKQIEQKGAGEILLNFIAKDGTFSGYDLDLIQLISNQIDIPLIACGGAANIKDFYNAVISGASAVAAGSMFVYKGDTKGILINYPDQHKIIEFYNSL